MGAVMQLSRYFDKYKAIEPVRVVDVSHAGGGASAARADAARRVLHVDLRRLRAGGGPGVHVRRGLHDADHGGHAGQSGERGGGFRQPAGDARALAGGVLRRVVWGL